MRLFFCDPLGYEQRLLRPSIGPEGRFLRAHIGLFNLRTCFFISLSLKRSLYLLSICASFPFSWDLIGLKGRLLRVSILLFHLRTRFFITLKKRFVSSFLKKTHRYLPSIYPSSLPCFPEISLVQNGGFYTFCYWPILSTNPFLYFSLKKVNFFISHKNTQIFAFHLTFFPSSFSWSLTGSFNLWTSFLIPLKDLWYLLSICPSSSTSWDLIGAGGWLLHASVGLLNLWTRYYISLSNKSWY